MKCIQFTDPCGGKHTLIKRVTNEEAEKLVNDKINKGLRKYVPKHLWKAKVHNAN